MKFKLTLALLSCMVMFAYVSYGKQQEEEPFKTIEEHSNIEFTSQNLSTLNTEQPLKPPIPINPYNSNPYQSENTQPKYQQNVQSWQKEPNRTEPLDTSDAEPIQPYETAEVAQGSYMTLTPTDTRNTMGNPIYELRLYGNGRLIATYQTVTGRAESQNRNRHQAGTEAPLPDGQYQVASTEVAGTHPEVGGRFLPVEPLFPTGRSALGIHYDPSFQKTNGEDGTEGCIALTNKRDLDQVLNYVHTYRPQYLEVKLQV
ncbi:MAG: L,D-transpeptidase [Crocosphaera sp.]|nr:L,D-transpeptidase [Crocosphaera sp.]